MKNGISYPPYILHPLCAPPSSGRDPVGTASRILVRRWISLGNMSDAQWPLYLRDPSEYVNVFGDVNSEPFARECLHS